ncbi:hypothetical protein FKW77_006000 [Venturia effusa]|uniref:Heme haloperoxidase family profile domain-containing protein n=1 Tax=Venturia effusa TaxID=50376 RepID=A0A517KZJ6_9PEZI|nr:hypothetical protein FKW77_006000 [Venturia effusa]
MCAAGLAGSALAFPAIMEEALEKGRKAGKDAKRALGVNPGFDAASQLIDVHGSHAWQAPCTKDLRGPCPGLNALANHGNNYLIQMSQWKDLYSTQAGVSDAESNFDLGVLTSFRAKRLQQSLDNNPYFFNGPFSGIAVQPAAYTFMYRFMANHSAENPAGQLTKSVLKSFFAITGTDDNPVYTPGYKKIPENWYRRSKTDEYSIPFFLDDLIAAAITYPQFLSVGGNTGTTNSFTGLDITNFAGGVYSTSTLLQGNNLQCFVFQAAQQAAPDLVKNVFSDVTSALIRLNNVIDNVLSGLGCPQLKSIDQSQFSKFPGYTGNKTCWKISAEGKM